MNKEKVKIWDKLKEIGNKYLDLLNYNDSTIKQKFIKSNFQKILPLSLMILFIAVINLIIYLFFSDNSAMQIFFIGDCCYLIIVCIITITWFFDIDNQEEFPEKRAIFLNRVFILSVFIGFLLFTLIEIHYSNTFYHLIIMGWLFTIFTFLTPSQAIPFSIFTTIFVSFAYPGKIPFHLLMNLLITLVFFLVITQFLYYTNKQYFMKEKKLKSKNKKLQKQLKEDYLTKIFNRTGLEEHVKILLPYAILSKVPIAVLMIDIDFFKNFNDTYGHLEGDHCLYKVAQAIKNSTKRETDMVCRFGGEEFLVFLYDIEPENIDIVIKRIQMSIRKLKIPTARKDASKYVSVSIGASHGVLTEKKNLEKLVELADKELYKSKERGRNTFSILKKAN